MKRILSAIVAMLVIGIGGCGEARVTSKPDAKSPGEIAQQQGKKDPSEIAESATKDTDGDGVLDAYDADPEVAETPEQPELPKITNRTISMLEGAGDDFEGAPVKRLVGQVFNIDREGEGVAVQMYTDSDQDGSAVVYLPGGTEVRSDDFIRVNGEVAGELEGENGFGAELATPSITASEVKKVSQTAFHPTLHRVGARTGTLGNVAYTIRKIEWARDETRVYLTVTNNGGENEDVATDPKVVARGRQMESGANFDYDFEDMSYELSPGATTKGVLVYKRMPRTGVRISFEGYNADYDTIRTAFDY